MRFRCSGFLCVSVLCPRFEMTEPPLARRLEGLAQQLFSLPFPAFAGIVWM